MEEAVRRVLTSDRKTAHLTPTWQDIDVLKSINSVLSQLTSLTDILSGENYVTISALLPLMDVLNNSILKNDVDDTELTETIKATIKNSLSSQYTDEDVVQLLEVSSLLDPRFKAKYLTESRVAEVKSLIISEGIDEQVRLPGPEQQAKESTSSSTSPPLKKRKTLGSFFKDKEQQNECGSGEQAPPKIPEEQLTIELQNYLSTPMLDAEEEPQPWWKRNEKKYPMLAIMARKYLCVCATSSASECLFSSSGQIVTSLRAHLNPNKVDMLVFLSNNL